MPDHEPLQRSAPFSNVAYSAVATDHFQRPRNVGALADASAVGVAANDENYVALYLRVDDGVVAKATFRALACNACIASASVLTVLITGRSLSRALAIDAADLIAALEGLPPEKRHCAELVCQALQRALEQLAAHT